MNIRLYTTSDYELLNSWWKKQDEPGPTHGMLTLDSTFIVEKNNKPVISVSLHLTNCEIAHIENFIANPEYKDSDRKQLIQDLFSFLQDFAKVKGYKTLVAMAYKDKLKKRYEQIGLTKTIDNLTSYIKELN
jgi:hypothetical protein